MASHFPTLRGTVESISQKRVARGTPWVGCVHNTRCFVNSDHTYTVTLMGVPLHQVQITFDRAMAMVNRRDSRSYAQVVSQPCASTFSVFPHMVNNKGLHNTRVSSHTIYANNNIVQSVDKTVSEFTISASHGDKQLVNAVLDLNAEHLQGGRPLDTCPSGRTTVNSPAGQCGLDPCVVPIKNRFLLSDADVESEEIDERFGLDPEKGSSPLNARACNHIRGQDTGSDIHNGSTQSEDGDLVFSSKLKVLGLILSGLVYVLLPLSLHMQLLLKVCKN